MRNKMIQKYTAAMDDIHFSNDAKDAMVRSLTAQKTRKTRYGNRKLMLIALAAAMALVTLTGAAAFTRWSKSAQAAYQPSQEEKELAESIGLSSMLETNVHDGDIICSTDQGVTITAVQTIVDRYSAQITFRIDGFKLPDGEEPHIGIASLGVKDVHSVHTKGSFYDGTRTTNSSEAANPDESAGTSYTAEDGSLEFTTTLLFTAGGEHFDKEIEVTFTSIGTTESPSLVRGEWKLKWMLTGMADTVVSKTNTPIGDTGVTLLEVEISPISLHTTYKIDTTLEVTDDAESYYLIHNLLNEIQPHLIGVCMEDGTIYTDLTTIETGFNSLVSDDGVTMKFPEYESIIVGKDAVLSIDCQLTNQILDPNQVDAFIYLKSQAENTEFAELTEEDFYIVPIK